MKTLRAHGIVNLITVIVIGIVGCLAPVAVLILSVKGLIENVDVLKYSVLVIAAAVLLTCGIYTIFIFLKKKIVLKEDCIYIPSDVKKSNSLVRKIQHETVIRYDEIQSIYLVLRATDTNDNPIPNCVTPMINLIFVCQDGTEKAANLHSYSQNQKAFLIDYICEKVKAISGRALTETTGKEMLKAFEANENKKFKRR